MVARIFRFITAVVHKVITVMAPLVIVAVVVLLDIKFMTMPVFSEQCMREQRLKTFKTLLS